MHANHLQFFRGGVGAGQRSYGPQRPYRVSPYLFPQTAILNAYFLANRHELPIHGLSAQVLAFDFGFATPALQIGAQDSQFFSYTLANNFLALGITGVSDVPPSQAVVPGAALPASVTFPIGVQVDPAYLVTLQQTHEGNTWQLENKPVTNREQCGTAENPLLFKSPVLIPAGDAIACTVQNLANTSLRVQIAVIGASF